MDEYFATASFEVDSISEKKAMEADRLAELALIYLKKAKRCYLDELVRGEEEQQRREVGEEEDQYNAGDYKNKRMVVAQGFEEEEDQHGD
nr:transcription factor VIP1-like [Ipomoea trifida]